MIIKIVTPEQEPQVEDLWDYCFEKKSDPFFKRYFEDYCVKRNIVFGCFEKEGEKDKLVAMAHVNPYDVRVRSDILHVPYLVGVATAPEARGQHLFASMAEAIFKELKTAGILFVTLMPVCARIYQPYGFSYCYFRHSYDIPLTSLACFKDAAGYRVRRAGLKENDRVLQELYDRLTACYNGVPQRDPLRWQLLLKVHKAEDVRCAVAYRDGEAAGYMLYKLKDETFEVVEFLCDSCASKASLLAYASRHKSEAERFSWLAAPDDLTFLDFPDQKHSGSFYPLMMARCIDPLAALKQLKVPRTLNLRQCHLRVTDPVIESNNVTIKCEASSGCLSVEPVEAEREDAIMGVGAFAQLYMGAFSFTQLLSAGRVRCADMELALALDGLFPKQVNYNNEYF